MLKSILRTQAQEKIQQLRLRLENFHQESFNSSEELAVILNEIRQAEQLLTVLEYHVRNNELSSDLDVHLKVLEKTDNTPQKQEEPKPVQEHVPPSPPEKVEIQQESSPAEIKQPAVSGTQPSRTIEFSINDKYRIINELFAQNAQEFSVALQQLNATKNWDDAQHYLTGLVDLYRWDEERESCKILFRAVQKRFS